MNLWLKECIAQINLFNEKFPDDTRALSLLAQVLKLKPKINFSIDTVTKDRQRDIIEEWLKNSQNLLLTENEKKKLGHDSVFRIENQDSGLGEIRTSTPKKDRVTRGNQTSQLIDQSDNQKKQTIPSRSSNNNNTTNKETNDENLLGEIGPSKILVDILIEIFKISNLNNLDPNLQNTNNNTHKKQPGNWTQTQTFQILKNWCTNKKMSIHAKLNQPIYDFVKIYLTDKDRNTDFIESFCRYYWIEGSEFSKNGRERQEDEIFRTSLFAKIKILRAWGSDETIKKISNFVFSSILLIFTFFKLPG